jgi:hypothetical protein
MEPASRYPTKQDSFISNYQQANNRGGKLNSPNTDPKPIALKPPKDVARADKDIPVGCQTFRYIRRIEKNIAICVVERVAQRKTEGL